MKRRDFIKIGMGGLAAIVADPLFKIPPIFRSEAHAAVRTFNLTMEAAIVEMIDRTEVFHWLFSSAQTGPSFPGPVIFVTTGDAVTITVKNNLQEPHAFQLVGTGFTTGPISPGVTGTLRFIAPAAGTYLYVDPLNAPVNRVLGLQGAFVVSPASGNTPYTFPTPSVQQLFNDLGTTAHFPRHALSPAGWQPDRFRIWLHHQIDPAFNARAQNGERISPTEMIDNFLPRYFTMNGKSGAFASHDPTVFLSGRIGQPMLVRILNAGLFTHSNHLHANHFYVTAVNNVVRDNVFAIDSLSINPLDRIDWLVPFERPGDIAGDPNIRLRDLIPNELALTIEGPNGSPGVPQSPLIYPMHCHMEPSQTAAGGNYPQGTVTHFELLGDIDGVDFPNAGGM